MSTVSENTQLWLNRFSLTMAAKLTLCAFFIQAWLVVLHFRLAGHDSLNVRVVGRAFDLTREATIPNAFSALLALAAGVAAGVLAGLFRRDNTSKARWMGWLGVMIVFLYIAADDASSLHERINAVVSLEFIAAINYPSYPWHVVLFPCFALAIAVSLWLVRADITRDLSQKLALIGALLCFAISQGFDFIEGWETMNRNPNDPISAQLLQMIVVEEVLEMIGTSLFLYVFLIAILTEFNKRRTLWVRKPEPLPESL